MFEIILILKIIFFRNKNNHGRNEEPMNVVPNKKKLL